MLVAELVVVVGASSVVLLVVDREQVKLKTVLAKNLEVG